MKRLKVAALALLSALGLTACEDDDTKYVQFQAVHASVDAPKANVWVDGKARFTGVDYASGSGYVRLEEGHRTLRVDVALPANATATVIPSTTLDLHSSMKYTAFVVGDAATGASNAVEALVVSRSATSTATSSTLDVQVLHAAAGIPDVNVYVTAPGASLSASQPVATLGYKDSSGVLNIAGGSYQVRLVTVSGSSVAYDSGSINLASGSELTIAAIKTGDTGSSSPVKLLVLDGTNSTVVHDTGSVAEVRVGHLVDGAPLVDVYIDGSAVTALDNLAYKQIRGYLDLSPKSYDIDVYADGTTTSPLIDVNGLALDAGKDYSIYAVGVVSPSVALEPIVVTDNRRPISTSAVLNVTHAAANPVAASVDVYLTSSSGIAGAQPAISGLAYKASTQDIYVAQGNYFVTVTVAGDPSTIAINSVPVTLNSGSVYQAVAIDDSGNGGFNLLLSDISD
ncbi:DUF4397 domain-containing protein [Vibrio sp. SCSIO 43136]|uniref:DUF4397 domain-containing protein n=1 Tax=Vibrio sp. SCSIO 43136 TaxID=2819101 RepID=UPI002074B6A3|nr:DUF4397 domain-containing protein [Vibrio sp. SCSIO 43136]USD65358.1 DUF4397 domain-containing protein [Vibrio sp. SCSIO 43136]